MSAPRVLAVFVVPEMAGSLGDWADLRPTPDPDEADVVLAGAAGWPCAAPVVRLGRGAASEAEAGVLEADADGEQIHAALRAAAAGLRVRAPAPPLEFGPLEDLALEDLLSPREVEVLKAMSGGASNKAIARALGISLHTVKFHVEAIFKKMDAHSRAEAVAKGLGRQRRQTVDL